MVRADDGRRGYTDDDFTFSAACRERVPPVRWTEIAKAMGRKVQSVHDFWVRRGNMYRVEEISEADSIEAQKRIEAKAEWPSWARFDGHRTHKMKPLYSIPAPTRASLPESSPARHLPHGDTTPVAVGPFIPCAPTSPARGPAGGTSSPQTLAGRANLSEAP